VEVLRVGCTPTTSVRYFVGLDLGQPNEFTALAVVAKTTVVRERHLCEISYAVRHLERFPIGTPYPEIFERLATLRANAQLLGNWLVVGQTGVGKAVVDMLRRCVDRSRMIPVTIASGLTGAGAARSGWVVAKLDLIGMLQVLLQTRKLLIAEGLPHAETLVKELLNFKVKPRAPAAKDLIVDWREGIHDDLIFAVGIALWYAERLPAYVGRPTVLGGARW
jgi:hypothetical protein